MLPAGNQVREMYLGTARHSRRRRPDTLLINSSTIDVATAREVGAAAAKRVCR